MEKIVKVESEEVRDVLNEVFDLINTSSECVRRDILESSGSDTEKGLQILGVYKSFDLLVDLITGNFGSEPDDYFDDDVVLMS